MKMTIEEGRKDMEENIKRGYYGKMEKEIKLCQTVNVGIKAHQKKQIIERLKYGESINKFVQDAVDKALKK